MGHGITKREVIDVVRKTIKKRRKRRVKTLKKFKFNSEGWWHGFVQRHPKLSLCTADTLSYCQSNTVDQESIDYYFSMLKKTLKGNNLMGQLCYIYNMDE